MIVRQQKGIGSNRRFSSGGVIGIVRKSLRRRFLGKLGAASVLSGGTVLTKSALGLTGHDVDAEKFPSVGTIEDWHDVSANYTPRPTGSQNDKEYLDWIENQLEEITGIHSDDIERRSSQIDRWLEADASLSLVAGNGTTETVPIIRSVPYSAPTGSDGVTAPVTYVPQGDSITDADVADRIVLRDVVPGSIPYSVLQGLSYFSYDPDGTFPSDGDYERGWLNTEGLITDIEAAANAGARGILFAMEFPREQRRGHYRPYHGDHYGIPGLFLGVDEAADLKTRLAESDEVRATIRLSTNRGPATVHSLRAVVRSSYYNPSNRIIVETHGRDERLSGERTARAPRARTVFRTGRRVLQPRHRTRVQLRTLLRGEGRSTPRGESRRSVR